MKRSSRGKKNFIVLIKETNDFDNIINFFMNRCWSKTGILVKLMRKVSMKWKNWRDFRVLHSTQLQERRLIEDQDTILELTGKIQELQNEINCMNDSRDFQDAESVRSGQSHVASQPVSFPPHPVPGGMLSRSIGMSSRKDLPPSIFDTHGTSGNVFCKFSRVFFSTFSRRSWIHGVLIHQNTHHHMWWVKTKTPVQDLRCQSGPSARNSVIPSEGDSSKNYGADQQRLQISDLHFDKFLTPTTYKIQIWGMHLFIISYGSYAMDQRSGDGYSVDDLKSSSSVKGIQIPEFEVLDAKIASALNRIIHNSHFKRRISLEEQKAPQRGPFPSRKTDRLLDLRALPGHWSQWCRRELCRPINCCSSKWWRSGIRFEMGRNSIVYDENPTWWHLGRIVQIKNTRVWETQDRIGIVWPGDSSEESRTWLSQIEDDGEKKYRARFTKQEFWCQKRKLWKKRRGQESGDKNSVDKEFLESISEFCHPKSQRKESQWSNVSMALQGSPQRNLHQFILYKVAPSRMLVLQVGEWLLFWWKLLICTSPGWWTAQKNFQK